ncbi:AAA family ATPase [Granulosicoccus sp.]|nr:AAA family ATPase [Granulosicoccus sp.]MDB4224300.1 AAA family ATPase [Granulosicoccus sp.]
MVDRVTLEFQLLTDLIDASLNADGPRIREVCSELSFALESDGDKKRAKTIRALLRKRGAIVSGSRALPRLPTDSNSQMPLIEEQVQSETPLFLNRDQSGVVGSFCEDAENAELLKKRGIPPRLFLMLSGPPGTGKSLLAGHVAARLSKPLLVVRLDALISSRLGDTAKNIREVFDHVAQRGGALFLDEMDAIAKVRDDRMELGELKRVVNTVLQSIDSLPEESVVIAATNHAQLLDSAIWRRFPYSIEVALPDSDVRSAMWEHFLFAELNIKNRLPKVLAQLSDGLSGSDIEILALACRRRCVLDDASLNFFALFEAVTNSTQGKPIIPSTAPLKATRKRDIVRTLVNKFNISKVLLAEILGVSRQMIYRYLKD